MFFHIRWTVVKCAAEHHGEPLNQSQSGITALWCHNGGQVDNTGWLGFISAGLKSG